jgi:hypothetical protein
LGIELIFKAMKTLAKMNSPAYMIELARALGMKESDIRSLSPHGRQQRGKLRAVLENLESRGVIQLIQIGGRRKFCLNYSSKASRAFRILYGNEG